MGDDFTLVIRHREVLTIPDLEQHVFQIGPQRVQSYGVHW